MPRLRVVGALAALMVLCSGRLSDAGQNWAIDIQYLDAGPHHKQVKGAMGAVRAAAAASTSTSGTDQYIGCVVDVGQVTDVKFEAVPTVFCDAWKSDEGVACTSIDSHYVDVVGAINSDSLIEFHVVDGVCSYLKVSNYSAFPPKQDKQ